MWSEGHGVLKDHTSWSTRTHLLLLGLAIAMPLLSLLAALLFASASTQRKELEQRLVQVLDTLVNDLDRDLDRDITILQTLATSQALAREDWPAFYEQAKAGLQGRAYLVLVDSTGRQLVNTYVPYGEQPAMTGDPETVRRMAQSGAPVVSNLFASLVVKQPVFNVSIPLMRDGQLRFIMSLGLLPRDLVALLASQNLAPEWVTTIWDANGTILARSRDNDRYLGKALPHGMRERSRPAVARTTNLDNADVLHAAARSRMSGWGVGVNVPYSLITAQLRNSLLLWGAAAILAMAVAAGLGLLLARRITASLAAAAQAAGGDRPTRQISDNRDTSEGGRCVSCDPGAGAARRVEGRGAPEVSAARIAASHAESVCRRSIDRCAEPGRGTNARSNEGGHSRAFARARPHACDPRRRGVGGGAARGNPQTRV
jgi:hypothetical protein